MKWRWIEMAEGKGKSEKSSKKSLIARQIRLLLLTVVVCVGIVVLAVALDLLFNPSKSWTESLAVKWISEKRTAVPFFK